MSPPSDEVHRRGPRWWLLLAAALPVALGALWGVATPVGASPDEGAHIRYAWAVATDQAFVDTRHPADQPDRLLVTGVAPLGDFVPPECYAFDFRQPAGDCGLPQEGASGVASTYMARYPLAYYLPVGAAFRAGLGVGVPSEVVLGGLRMASGAVSGLLVVVAGWLLVRRYRPLAVVSVLTFAMTPMAWFLSGSINPNGFEVATAALLAACVVAIRRDCSAGAALRWPLLTLLPLATLLLAHARPVSVVWAALLLAVLLVPLRSPTAGRLVPAFRLPWWTLGGCLLALVTAAAFFTWLTQARSDDTVTTSGTLWEHLPTVVQVVLVQMRLGDVAGDAIGTFGWLDTALPDALVLLWVLSLAVVLVRWLDGGAVRELPRWLPPAVVAGGMAAVSVHTMVTAFGWQGRYYLPFLAGALVLALPGVSAAASRVTVRRSLAAATAVAWLVHCLSPAWAWGRHALGLEIALGRFERIPRIDGTPVRWWPGEVWPTLLAASTVLLVVGLVVLGRLLAESRRSDGSAVEDAGASGVAVPEVPAATVRPG